jgi:nicotinamide mononucleotide transporter
MNNIINWLSENYIELSGTIISFIYLYFSIKQNILLWLTGLISALLYAYVFFHAKFYADMSLQVYYIVISIYGWIYWANKLKENKEHEFPIQKYSTKQWLIFILLTSIGTYLTGYFLDNYTDSPVPYWDAFTTISSFIATWMLAKKYIENWLIWIVVDFVSMILYFWKGLYTTVILFAVYTIMGFVGYLEWKKSLKTEDLNLINPKLS